MCQIVYVTVDQCDVGTRGPRDMPPWFRPCYTVAVARSMVQASVGFNMEPPQQVYDGCYSVCLPLIESIKRSGTVSRAVFTSSMAACFHPPYVTWQRIVVTVDMTHSKF